MVRYIPDNSTYFKSYKINFRKLSKNTARTNLYKLSTPRRNRRPKGIKAHYWVKNYFTSFFAPSVMCKLSFFFTKFQLARDVIPETNSSFNLLFRFWFHLHMSFDVTYPLQLIQYRSINRTCIISGLFIYRPLGTFAQFMDWLTFHFAIPSKETIFTTRWVRTAKRKVHTEIWGRRQRNHRNEILSLQ
jgi:hypothetical protein